MGSILPSLRRGKAWREARWATSAVCRLRSCALALPVASQSRFPK